MPSPAFADSLRFVLRWEGGFVDHRADPGGRTNKGVTQRVYTEWRARKGLPPRDVLLIEDGEVGAIYESDYWRPPGCELLRRQLDLVQFDTAVNMGVKRAVRFLQAALGCAVDGAFGSITKGAASECDLGGTIGAYCDSREAYYRRLVVSKPDLGVFLKGWMNRLNALRDEVAGTRGLEALPALDLGDAGYVGRIPDLGEVPGYDV